MEFSIFLEQLVIFSYIMIISQSIFSLLQFITLTPIGHLGACLGDTQAETLVDRLLLAQYSVGRAMGTLGSPNLVARAIIVLTPFILVSGFFSKLGRVRLSISLYKRLTIMAGAVTLVLTISRASIVIFVAFGLIACLVYFLSRIKQHFSGHVF
jgi:hypothetical protein